jgi:hypothetical protein
MYATVGWILLLVACGLVELLARRPQSRTSTLSQFGALIASRMSGRVLLTILWIFVGVHLFTRYTIPRR